MKPKENIDFYQHLGKLFYAIAAADNYVRIEELNKLEEIINNEWITSEDIQDDYKTRLKTSIITTFRWLHFDHEYDCEECYNSFISFKRTHEALFSPEINALILKTAGKIAASFSGQNKSELIMLANLSIEFKKTPTNEK